VFGPDAEVAQVKSMISPYHDDGVAGQVEPIEFGDHFSDLGIHVAYAGIAPPPAPPPEAP
jgi:hypothetical protein